MPSVIEFGGGRGTQRLGEGESHLTICNVSIDHRGGQVDLGCESPRSFKYYAPPRVCIIRHFNLSRELLPLRDVLSPKRTLSASSPESSGPRWQDSRLILLGYVSMGGITVRKTGTPRQISIIGFPSEQQTKSKSKDDSDSAQQCWFEIGQLLRNKLRQIWGLQITLD